MRCELHVESLMALPNMRLHLQFPCSRYFSAVASLLLATRHSRQSRFAIDVMSDSIFLPTDFSRIKYPGRQKSMKSATLVL